MKAENIYQLPELGYQFDALEPEHSAELLELHSIKHHQGYVDGANSTRADLVDARLVAVRAIDLRTRPYGNNG